MHIYSALLTNDVDEKFVRGRRVLHKKDSDQEQRPTTASNVMHGNTKTFTQVSAANIRRKFSMTKYINIYIYITYVRRVSGRTKTINFHNTSMRKEQVLAGLAFSEVSVFPTTFNKKEMRAKGPRSVLLRMLCENRISKSDSYPTYSPFDTGTSTSGLIHETIITATCACVCNQSTKISQFSLSARSYAYILYFYLLLSPLISSQNGDTLTWYQQNQREHRHGNLDLAELLAAIGISAGFGSGLANL